MAESPIDGAKELQTMLVDYARQETVDPLKSLGRFLSFGLAGAALVGIGSVFLALGVLRLVQALVTDGGGLWSTLAYIAALAVLAIVLAILGSRLRASLAKVKQHA